MDKRYGKKEKRRHFLSLKGQVVVEYLVLFMVAAAVAVVVLFNQLRSGGRLHQAFGGSFNRCLSEIGVH